MGRIYKEWHIALNLGRQNLFHLFQGFYADAKMARIAATDESKAQIKYRWTSDRRLNFFWSVAVKQHSYCHSPKLAPRQRHTLHTSPQYTQQTLSSFEMEKCNMFDDTNCNTNNDNAWKKTSTEHTSGMLQYEQECGWLCSKVETEPLKNIN